MLIFIWNFFFSLDSGIKSVYSINIYRFYADIRRNENMETKVQGIYAIGDVRQKSIRQIVTAASDGAIAGKILTNKIKK
mgnify:CR=1 FL=1